MYLTTKLLVIVKKGEVGIKVNIIKDRLDRPNHDKALGGTGGSTLERSEVRALMRSIV